MDTTEQPGFGGVVTSDSRRKRSLLWRLWPAWVGLLVLVLGGGSYAAYRFWPVLTSSKRQANTQTSQQHSLTPAQVLADAQTALQKAQTPSAKVTAYEQLGAAYLANGQAPQALQAYQSASAGVSTTDTDSQVKILFGEANAYDANQQPNQEVAALQQAIELLKKSSNPYAEGMIQYAQTQIDRIQGTSSQ